MFTPCSTNMGSRFHISNSPFTSEESDAKRRRDHVGEESQNDPPGPLPGESTHPGGDEDGVSISPTSESGKLPLLKADPLANLKKVTKPDLKNFAGTANREDLY